MVQAEDSDLCNAPFLDLAPVLIADASRRWYERVSISGALVTVTHSHVHSSAVSGRSRRRGLIGRSSCFTTLADGNAAYHGGVYLAVVRKRPRP